MGEKGNDLGAAAFAVADDPSVADRVRDVGTATRDAGIGVVTGAVTGALSDDLKGRIKDRTGKAEDDEESAESDETDG
ncbi:MAG: hypothetical protein KDB02_10895 [Acidimicrobiales bacterium]|nr:hypothetical protein [Acidimicrobiales bacterium]